MKGYRSDYDILVMVSSKKLAEPQYWDKATDRLMWDKGVSTPVELIAHGAREVNNFLADGQYFLSTSCERASCCTSSTTGHWPSRNRSLRQMRSGWQRSIFKGVFPKPS